MNHLEILDRLISFRSVVGTPNGDIVGWIADYLRSHGAEVHLLPGPEGDRSNLFAMFGPKDEAGYILSGHMDVVAANEPDWATDPFRLTADRERLHGRGTSDMKGFLATALAAAPSLKLKTLKKPIHLACSYDEEATCRGVPHMIAKLPDLCRTPLGAVIGEPTGMQPVLAHKGKSAARIIIRGKSGHSAQPHLGINAIHAAVPILAQAVQSASALAKGPFDHRFDPPYSSLQVGTIKGGVAVNIIPENCAFDIEARAIAGQVPDKLLSDIRGRVEEAIATGCDVEWIPIGSFPALSLRPDSPLAVLVSTLSGAPAVPAVSFGTEAGLFQEAGINAIICGPGDIGRAHKPNEFIQIDELMACVSMINALVEHCCD